LVEAWLRAAIVAASSGNRTFGNPLRQGAVGGRTGGRGWRKGHASHKGRAGESFYELANIRLFEYSKRVQNLLREYKASIFQALAHPTRVAIVEVLAEGEASAGSIQERLGVEQANISQHLAILRSRRIVTNRKEGNQVFYSLRNKALVKVLDMMRRYFQEHLAESAQMLGEIAAERPAR
jgi:DNA-binding transcriptional ArsR family regulator